jgi:hypothetical protein
MGRSTRQLPRRAIYAFRAARARASGQSVGENVSEWLLRLVRDCFLQEGYLVGFEVEKINAGELTAAIKPEADTRANLKFPAVSSKS